MRADAHRAWRPMAEFGSPRPSAVFGASFRGPTTDLLIAIDPPIQEPTFAPNAIGNDSCVADPVRFVGYSDRAHAPYASDVDLLRDIDGVIYVNAEPTLSTTRIGKCGD